MLNSIMNKVWYYVTIKITKHILFFGEELLGRKNIEILKFYIFLLDIILVKLMSKWQKNMTYIVFSDFYMCVGGSQGTLYMTQQKK